jgi:hypothetical protein
LFVIKKFDCTELNDDENEDEEELMDAMLEINN